MMSRWVMRTTILLTVLLGVSGTNHYVGGPFGWDLSSNVQVWSAANTFYVGDILVFKYPPVHNVLEVNQLEFNTCRPINPISVGSSGNTLVHLTHPGRHYFISGQNGDCAMGLKLWLDALPDQLADNETIDGIFPRPRPRPSPSRPNHPSPPPPSIPDFDLPWPPPIAAFPPPGPETASPPAAPPAKSGVGGTMWARCLGSLFATILGFVINYVTFDLF